KLGKSKISKITGNSRNISQSAYYWLFVAAKGTVDRENKVADLFNLMLNQSEQAIEWMIFGRSPRIEKYLMKKWELSRLYIINLINRTRRQLDKYCSPELKFNSKNPLLSQKEIEIAIKQCYEKKRLDLESPDMSKQVKTFLNKLKLLASQVEIVAPILTSWNNIEQKSRWKSIRQLNTMVAEAVGKKNVNFFSVLRTIIVFALFPNIGKTVARIIRNTHPKKVVNPPFMKRKKGRIPIILLMKDRLVVMRPGNAKYMTFLAKADGEFEIGFLLKGFSRITAKLVFSEKVRNYLLNGAEIRVLYIKSSPAPSYKVRVSVVLEGPAEVFISTKLTEEFAKRIKTPKDDFIGLDINRISEHMIALSNGIKMPKELKLLIDRYRKITRTKIPELHYSLTNKGKKKDSLGYVKTKGELRRIYVKRLKIRREIKNFVPHFLAAVMVKTKCKAFFLEDLEIDPRGKKGALGKAISNMIRDLKIFEKAVLIASSILGYEIKLANVDSRGTSRFHNKCGGVLERNLKRYDRVKCKKCGKTVDTHVNAAKNIREKGKEISSSKNHPSTHARGMGKLPSSESKQTAEV
ncbi:MAG: zinc ribbon domain-containing protein, partial [Candidatus Thorarchaeota archaeon]